MKITHRRWGSITGSTEITNDLTLQEEAGKLAQQLFGSVLKSCANFTNELLDICTRAQGKDLLVIHNPGGFGSTPLEHLLEWERSIVEGVSATIELLGCNWLLTQYFRTGDSWWAHVRDMKEQVYFFFKGESSKAKVMAAELKFIVQHVKNLKILL
ncbi:hypothetical protein ACFLUW_00840, partial [Chloroflexota bacterium]